MKKRLTRNLVSIISLCICIGFTIFTSTTSRGLRSFRNAFRGLKAGWIFVAIASVVISWIFDALSLHILSKGQNKSWSFIDSFQIAMVGLFYSAITPSASGGQPMQIYFLKKKGMAISDATMVVLKRSIVWQAVLVAYASILMLLYFNYFEYAVDNLIFLTIIGISTGTIFVTFLFFVCSNQKLTSKVISKIFSFLSRFKFKNIKAKQQKVMDKLVLFHESMKKSNQDLKTYLSLGFCSLIGVASLAAIPFFLYKSFGFRGTQFIPMLAADAFVMMITYFIPLPGAAGGAELTFPLFFKLFFINDTIVTAVILWRLFTYYSRVVFGALVSVIKPETNYGTFIRRRRGQAKENA